ncbi:helix-turn-helix domain-containing protein [Mediterraneibacter glycyrrhizinilyticus]|uniref:helix-turn-helix domain-containing protein n=1 Tax=Mediterraneibacter glycyrrhizinilyticus TaxID=342942 RepID=UPI0019605285|nr:helix-turn-helix domain-containing protein [Mediterraneibacter glycyrrhizinilyticus]MBM6751310.1 helix-turn-helix domain-containing protein [Mediterraneibacter glycyrrhizinilyticus]
MKTLKDTRITEQVTGDKRRRVEEEAPLMLSIRDIAKKSGISIHTVRLWVDRGDIPYILAGNKRLISWHTFCQFLNGDMRRKKVAR